MFQNFMMVAAALMSVGTTIAIVYPIGETKKIRLNPYELCLEFLNRHERSHLQKFQPTAAPRAGSTNAVAWRIKPPVLGMKVVISPVVYDTPSVMRPMKV